MIHNDEQLKRTREALCDLEEAMAALNRKKGQMHPDRFALMAEPILDHIRQLRAAIDTYTGVTAATVAEAPLWLRLEGPEVSLDDAPSSILTAMIDILRVGIQAVAEFLQRGARGGRPTAVLREACDLRMVGLLGGSVQVGLRLPEPSGTLFDGQGPHEQARKALQVYLQAAGWVSSQDGVQSLEELIPDQDERLLILNQLSRLVPRPRGGLEAVELTGRAVPSGTVRLRRESRERIRAAVTHILSEEPQQVEGVIREIDLDQRTFIVRNFDGEPETRCEIPEGNEGLLEIAREALDYRVIVVGTRKSDPTKRRSTPLQVREIDIQGKDLDDTQTQPTFAEAD